MKSITETLNGFYNLFYNLPCTVTHYTRSKNPPPFVIWAEEGEEESFHSNNRKSEQQITGTVNFFTKTEFDPLVDVIQTILNDNTLAWTLESVMYEEETNLIHYTWRWSISGTV